MTDVALIHLERLTKLELLNLSGTHVTDDGLNRLRGPNGLRQLFVNETKVTPSGAAALHEALPQLQISGADPRVAVTNTNLTASRFVLNQGLPKDHSAGWFSHSTR